MEERGGDWGSGRRGGAASVMEVAGETGSLTQVSRQGLWRRRRAGEGKGDGMKLVWVGWKRRHSAKPSCVVTPRIRECGPRMGHVRANHPFLKGGWGSDGEQCYW